MRGCGEASKSDEMAMQAQSDAAVEFTTFRHEDRVWADG